MNGQNNGQNNGQYNHGQNSGQNYDQYNRGPNSGQNNGQFNHIPKRRDTTDFQCLQIGEVTDKATDRTGCAQVFDTLATANLACSLFENCLLIGHNNGYFELFAESEDNTAMDLQDYELSIPTMAKSQTNLKYGKYNNRI